MHQNAQTHVQVHPCVQLPARASQDDHAERGGQHAEDFCDGDVRLTDREVEHLQVGARRQSKQGQERTGGGDGAEGQSA